MEMTDEMVEMVAKRMRVIGDPVRIRILSLLREQEATVGELTERIGTTQQNISRHLAVLHGDGIVRRRREGRKVWYSLRDGTVSAICDSVCDSVTARIVDMQDIVEVEA